MYDELIKRLRETSVDFGESDHISVMMIEAANAIEDLIMALTASNEVIAKNKPKWIPVTERLPEESGSYLIVDSGHVTEAYYGKEWAGDNWTDPVEMYMTFHPTHWMPLPQPPESDDSLSCGICDDSKQKSNNGACSADETSEKVQSE